MSYPQQYGGYGPPQQFHGRPPMQQFPPHQGHPPYGPPGPRPQYRGGGPPFPPQNQNPYYNGPPQPPYYQNHAPPRPMPPARHFAPEQYQQNDPPPRPAAPPRQFGAVPPPANPTFARDRRSNQHASSPAESAPSNKNPDAIVNIFIGNIDERVSETLMTKLISKCGNVGSWRRVLGANNKLQAFGFCEYVDAESALRAIRLLDQLRLGSKELKVNLGKQNHPLVLAYKAQMKAKLGLDADEDAVDEDTLRLDQRVRDEIAVVIEEHEEELEKPLPDEAVIKTVKRVAKDGSIEEIEMEEDKRMLIHREIAAFRETYKGSEEVLEERIKAAGREKSGRREGTTDRSSVDAESIGKRSVSPEVRRTRKSRSRSVASDSSGEVVTRMPVKRRDTKRLAEQEKLYQEQLELWLAREKQMAKERAREEEKEKEKRANEKRTAKRLIRVYEDYDDDRMDAEYYSGQNLSRLLKDRKKELEADNRDREKEQQLLEELKQQLIKDGHPAPEAHVRQLELKQNEHLITQTYKEALENVSTKTTITITEEPASDLTDGQKLVIEETTEVMRESTSLSFSGPSSKLVKRAGEVFGTGSDDENADSQAERRKRLFRYDDEAEKKRQAAEQKKVMAKKLIETIPTKRDELFDYPLYWEALDKSLMEGRVKPWISKKIQDYIGEEEPTLVEFITQKVSSKAAPRSIVSDISMVLDDDAEVFVMKLWRLLVYETEMKKAGLPAGESDQK